MDSTSARRFYELPRAAAKVVVVGSRVGTYGRPITRGLEDWCFLSQENEAVVRSRHRRLGGKRHHLGSLAFSGEGGGLVDIARTQWLRWWEMARGLR